MQFTEGAAEPRAEAAVGRTQVQPIQCQQRLIQRRVAPTAMHRWHADGTCRGDRGEAVGLGFEHLGHGDRQ
jgi:hypothetical protein